MEEDHIQVLIIADDANVAVNLIKSYMKCSEADIQSSGPQEFCPFLPKISLQCVHGEFPEVGIEPTYYSSYLHIINLISCTMCVFHRNCKLYLFASYKKSNTNILGTH